MGPYFGPMRALEKGLLNDLAVEGTLNMLNTNKQTNIQFCLNKCTHSQRRI